MSTWHPENNQSAGEYYPPTQQMPGQDPYYQASPGSYGSAAQPYGNPQGYQQPMQGYAPDPYSQAYGVPMGYAGVPAPYGVDPMTGLPYSDKSKLAAGLLSIFLGSLGVGRFYTGHWGIALGQIAATWLTFGIGSIWPLIDGIITLTSSSPKDVQGRVLRP